MSFRQEIKDFLQGWSGVNQIQGQYDDQAYKRMRTKLAEQQLQDASDPELRSLKKQLLRANVGAIGAKANWYNSGGQRTRGAIQPENYDNAPLAPAEGTDMSVPGPTSDAGTYQTSGLAPLTGGTT